MEFNVGDKVVYPGHGVGAILNVQVIDIDGYSARMYLIKILDNGMTISVPTQNAGGLGIREIISPEQVGKVYEVLQDRDVPADNQTWNRRYRDYQNKMHTGDPIEVAKVLRDLALLRKDKNLSFGERKMYDKASSLLIQELSEAEQKPEPEVRARVEQIFKT
jgi:CarD family transcriptional regulator